VNALLTAVNDLRCYLSSLIAQHETAKTWRLPDGAWVSYGQPMTADEVAEDMGFEPEDVKPVCPQGDLQ
jgi:hypothetical protein